jgi:hypothetical protein
MLARPSASSVVRQERQNMLGTAVRVPDVAVIGIPGTVVSARSVARQAIHGIPGVPTNVLNVARSKIQMIAVSMFGKALSVVLERIPLSALNQCTKCGLWDFSIPDVDPDDRYNVYHPDRGF